MIDYNELVDFIAPRRTPMKPQGRAKQVPSQFLCALNETAATVMLESELPGNV
jgi:hypothetical protein